MVSENGIANILFDVEANVNDKMGPLIGLVMVQSYEVKEHIWLAGYYSEMWEAT